MYVNIKYGVHHNNEIKGVFPLKKAYNSKAGHLIISVPSLNETFPRTLSPRVKTTPEQFFYCDADGKEVADQEKTVNEFMYKKDDLPADAVLGASDAETEFLSTETEPDAMRRIKGTFEMMDRMALAACNSVVTGLVISGPPGIGKSHGVISVLERENEIFQTVRTLSSGSSHTDMFEVVGGTASNLHLYMKLYTHRDKGQVLVLDDSDVILFDEECLGTLKTVLDTGKRRRISYLKESRTLEDEDIPKQFDFNGSVIFLTNLDFEKSKNSKIKTHLEAIMSRCHYMDMAIDSNRDKILRIKQIVGDGMLDEYSFDEETINMIVKYIEDNQDFLRELSLRMVIKIARLVKADPLLWEKDVEATCLRRDARYKRLLAERIKANEESA